jgi:hypothetical protein
MVARARAAQRGQGRRHGTPEKEEEHCTAVSGSGGELGHDFSEYGRGAGGLKRNTDKDEGLYGGSDPLGTH